MHIYVNMCGLRKYNTYDSDSDIWWKISAQKDYVSQAHSTFARVKNCAFAGKIKHLPGDF